MMDMAGATLYFFWCHDVIYVDNTGASMAKQPFRVINGEFQMYDEYEDRITIRFDITQEPAVWQDHLKRMKSVRVTIVTQQGFRLTFSCYRQQHPNLPLGFWYAMKRINKKVRKFYIGKDTNMTMRKFIEVAPKVCQTRIV
jgi:hypothetical protein